MVSYQSKLFKLFKKYFNIFQTLNQDQLPFKDEIIVTIHSSYPIYSSHAIKFQFSLDQLKLSPNLANFQLVKSHLHKFYSNVNSSIIIFTRLKYFYFSEDFATNLCLKQLKIIHPAKNYCFIFIIVIFFTKLQSSQSILMVSFILK